MNASRSVERKDVRALRLGRRLHRRLGRSLTLLCEVGRWLRPRKRWQVVQG